VKVQQALGLLHLRTTTSSLQSGKSVATRIGEFHFGVSNEQINEHDLAPNSDASSATDWAIGYVLRCGGSDCVPARASAVILMVGARSTDASF
jgi:hypothetical protein